MSAPVILIVEDEPLISLMLQEFLEDAGYEVLAAANADAAIPILESRMDIRVVITDIDMPGSMDGLKLAACVRDRWPPLKIIVTSGKHRPGISDMPSGSLFLAKPYGMNSVVEAVRRFI
jgi:DNA-binding NtrC family response regulator